MGEGAVLEHKIETLHADVREIESVLKELSTAVTKLALIEERQSQTAAALERAFVALAKVEDRVSKLELQAPATSRVTAWVDRALFAAAGVLAVLVLKQAGLM